MKDMIILSASIIPKAGAVANGRLFEANKPGLLAEQIKQACELAGKRPREFECALVDIGPGSFTGMRIVCAMAKAFGEMGMETLTLSSLDVGAYLSGLSGEFIVGMDAKRGNFYIAEYSSSSGALENISGPKLLTSDMLGQVAIDYTIRDYSIEDILNCFSSNPNLAKTPSPQELTPLYLYPLDCSIRKS